MARGGRNDTTEVNRVRAQEQSPFRGNRTGHGPKHNEIDGFHGPGQVNKSPSSPAPERGSRKPTLVSG